MQPNTAIKSLTILIIIYVYYFDTTTPILKLYIKICNYKSYLNKNNKRDPQRLT